MSHATETLSREMLAGRDAPAIFSAGIAQLANGYPGGTTTHIWNSFQGYDDAFLTRGTHALKFGFAVERMQYNPTNLYQPNGIVRFGGSLERFLTNQVKSLEGSRADRLTGRSYRQTLYGGYIQDDWHWRHNLTLNLGLRYEMTTVLTETVGRYTNLSTLPDAQPYCGTTDLAITNVFGKPGCSKAAPYYSNPTTKNFEPRFGFSWDPRGDGKTAVRGGFAIFDILPLPGYFYTQQGIETPFFLVGVVSNLTPSNGIGVLAANANSAFKKIGGNALTAAYMEPNPRRNYIEQWNINVQRQITPNLTATVGYIGSHGVHMLIRGDDGNMVLPTQTSAGFLWPFNPTGKDMRINSNFGGIRFMSFGTDASYEALQFNVQKRMSHGFQFGGSYTYSKAMDNSSATIAGDAFSNSITSWFWFAPQISHAVSDFNVTHSAAINAIWQVPGPRAKFAGAVLGGWQLGSILKLNSGIPTTPIIGGDPLKVQNNGSDTFSIPDRVPGCDPVNHDYKSGLGRIPLGYINHNCFPLPNGTPAIASQSVPVCLRLPPTRSKLFGSARRH